MGKKKTASQTGKMSRRKGKAFECFCARYFTAWTNTKWESTRNSGRTDLSGDVYCVEKPYLSLIIECKNRKAYSVHAMLKPTKAFMDMIDECCGKISNNQFIIFIIKNETGIWMSSPMTNKGVVINIKFKLTHNAVGIRCYKNTKWYKIQDYESNHPIDFEGIHFGKNPRF